jgi:hypothetical protein
MTSYHLALSDRRVIRVKGNQPLPDSLSHPESFIVRADQPLVGVIVHQNGTEMVRYTAGEPVSDRPSRQRSIQHALDLAGAWSDLAFDEIIDPLERIRHESKPTSPIDLSDFEP